MKHKRIIKTTSPKNSTKRYSERLQHSLKRRNTMVTKKVTPKKKTTATKKVTPKKKKTVVEETPDTAAMEETMEETSEVDEKYITAVNEMNEIFGMDPLLSAEQSEEDIIATLQANSKDIAIGDKNNITPETWECFKELGMLTHLTPNKKTAPVKKSPKTPAYTRASAFGNVVKETEGAISVSTFSEAVNSKYMEKGNKDNPKESLWITNLGIKILVSVDKATVKDKTVTFSL